MSFILLYFRILRLSTCNRGLLRMYYALFRDNEIMDESEKNVISTRIEMRERIEQELSECLKNMKAENHTLPNKGYIYSLSVIVQLEDIFKRMIYNANWESFYEMELSNVNQYYDLLYSENLPKSIMDLLLSQKAEIEENIMQEI